MMRSGTRTGLLAATALALALCGSAALAGSDSEAGIEASPAIAHAPPTSLVDAARTDDHDAAVAFLAAGGDIDAASPDGTTALMWAAYTDDVDLARRLIAAGADVHATNFYNATPMSQAAIVADAAMIELLLDAGVDPNEPGQDGMTPLMAVVRTAHVDAAELLIDRGADVNAIEQWKGQTALMWASAQSQPEMVALLIDHGADPNVQSNANNHRRQITAEPRYLWRPPGGLTALMYAARQGCVGCARALVEGGAEIDAADPEGATALLTATMNFRWDAAAYLIEAGANVNKWDWRGRNPLYNTVDLNTLPHGGRPDQPSSDETTALEVAEMLLDRGANPNLQLKLNPGYRHTKDDRGSDAIVQTLGATPLLRAAKAFDTPAIELLVARGALVDLPNVNGVQPIHAAAGMDSRVTDTRGVFDTPDVQQRSIAALQALLDGGADVNAIEGRGRTAVFSAAAWGWNDVVEFLVDHGARLDVIDAGGNTVHDMAMGLGGGRYGALGPVHEDTAALIERLSEEQAASADGEEGDPA